MICANPDSQVSAAMRTIMELRFSWHSPCFLYYDAVDARESADEVTETPDVPEVDGAENTTNE